MTVLPASSDFTATPVTEGQFKAAISGLRDFLSGLLGADGLTATALATLGGLGASISSKTAAYTVATADRGRVLDCSGTWTLSLPAAATAGVGFSIILRNGGSGVITVDPNAAELVNGVATLAIAAGQTTILTCNGTAWITAGAVGNDAAAFLAITGTAYQSSLTDSTVGRLLKVGAFGWGGNDISTLLVTDLDPIRTGGFFRWSTGAAGAPETAGALLHIPRLAGLALNGSHQQLAFGSTGKIWFRATTNTGTWTAWTALASFNADGMMSINGNAIGAQSITIADDAVGIITVPRQGGFADITCNGASDSPAPGYSGQVYFDAGTTLQIIKSNAFTGLSAKFNVVTTDVAGTTGTDTYVTVAVQAGVLKIENRSGVACTFQVSFS